MGNNFNNSYEKLFDLNSSESVIDFIQKNPKYLFYFYQGLLKNNSKLNDKLEIFKYNIKKLYDIIINFNEFSNKDFYISLSCIFGAFFFDSCGSHCEFLNKNDKNHELIYEKENQDQIFKNGQITDDSEMAISRAYAIMDSKKLSTLNTDNIFYYYGVWFNLEPLDIGLTTQNALMCFDKNNMILNGNDQDNYFFNKDIKNFISNCNKNSLANGALMKISTLIVWFFYVKNFNIKKIFCNNNPKKVELLELFFDIYIEVEKDTTITHPNIENIIACSIFVFLTLSIMCENTGKKTIKFVYLLLENDIFKNDEIFKKVKDLINKSLSYFEYKNFDARSYFKVYDHMGYYIHAFQLSLYYLSKIDDLLLTKEKNKIFIKIIEEICDLGGDTDTNGAIVGTLIGPIIGYKNFIDKNNKLESGLFETFLKFFDKKRILYTSSLMYYYVEFLEKNCKNINNNNHTIKINSEFNVLKLFLNLLNNKI